MYQKSAAFAGKNLKGGSGRALLSNGKARGRIEMSVNKVKRFLSSAVLVAALLAVCVPAFATVPVNLYVDTQLIQTDTPPQIVGGRTLVPARAILEAVGATVEWDAATKTATGTKNDTVVKIVIGSKTAYVNDESKTLDVPAQIINNRTMLPARFVSEALNCTVTWDSKTRTAAVADKLKGQKIYVTKTGKKYHYDNTCNGGTYYEATLATLV
jgi:hypothetical protein